MHRGAGLRLLNEAARSHDKALCLPRMPRIPARRDRPGRRARYPARPRDRGDHVPAPRSAVVILHRDAVDTLGTGGDGHLGFDPPCLLG